MGSQTSKPDSGFLTISGMAPSVMEVRAAGARQLTVMPARQLGGLHQRQAGDTSLGCGVAFVRWSLAGPRRSWC